MRRRRTWLFLSLFVFAVPLLGHEPEVVLVLIDTANNRAYIPEGTVVPPGKTVRASVTRVPVNGFTMERPRAGERTMAADARATRLRNQPPLVFEYAPASKFVEARARYEAFKARHRSGPKASSHIGNCGNWYYTTSGTGVRGTYYSEFIEKGCSGGWVGDYAWWTFGATAAAEDDGYVFVADSLGNYTCDDSGGGYRVRSCEAESFQRYAGYHVNSVVIGGHTALIEWLDNYEPNYVWFNIEINWQLWHY